MHMSAFMDLIRHLFKNTQNDMQSLEYCINPSANGVLNNRTARDVIDMEWIDSPWN